MLNNNNEKPKTIVIDGVEIKDSDHRVVNPPVNPPPLEKRLLTHLLVEGQDDVPKDEHDPYVKLRTEQLEKSIKGALAPVLKELESLHVRLAKHLLLKADDLPSPTRDVGLIRLGSLVAGDRAWQAEHPPEPPAPAAARPLHLQEKAPAKRKDTAAVRKALKAADDRRKAKKGLPAKKAPAKKAPAKKAVKADKKPLKKSAAKKATPKKTIKKGRRK